jgi:hypothetical protein
MTFQLVVPALTTTLPREWGYNSPHPYQPHSGPGVDKALNKN